MFKLTLKSNAKFANVTYANCIIYGPENT